MATGFMTLTAPVRRDNMKITWLGHAAFLIEVFDQKIIMDPFDEYVGYKIYNKVVDYVTVSHEHQDHNVAHLLSGSPTIIDTIGKHQHSGVEFTGIASYHDPEQGALRGENIIFKLSAEDINLVHLGDLGQVLNEEQLAAIGEVDILLIPVGGVYTIDAKEAVNLINRIMPKVIIPMHYKTPELTFALAPVEDFTQHFEVVVKKPYIEVSKSTLAQENRVILLDYLSWLT